jgi:glucose-1-phosphate thymidylyltransferase
MKGIIACGGLGTRLYPLTYATNKHLLPIYDKPMIHYPIQTLVEAGVTDILCIVGGPHAGHFFNALKDGKALGIENLYYAYQDGLGGAGEALMLAEDFANGEPVVFILGDQVTDASLSDAISNFKGGATILLQKYMDPDGMGVPVFDSNDPSKIVTIEENPSEPKSEYAATGVYIYDNKCFSYIRECQKTVEGEIKPTHINNKYIAKGELYWKNLDGYWVDAGKFDRLNEANNYFAKKIESR